MRQLMYIKGIFCYPHIIFMTVQQILHNKNKSQYCCEILGPYYVLGGCCEQESVYRVPSLRGNRGKLFHFNPVREFEKNALNQGQIREF